MRRTFRFSFFSSKIFLNKKFLQKNKYGENAFKSHYMLIFYLFFVVVHQWKMKKRQT